MPDFIFLPRDEAGRPIIPQSRITALVEARDAWASELGTLDTVTRSITRGQLVMPRISAPSQQKALRNHPSWENDEDAKLKVQELWHAKARKLNIPLSAKGHPVGQSGAFTGVAIDSRRKADSARFARARSRSPR